MPLDPLVTWDRARSGMFAAERREKPGCFGVPFNDGWRALDLSPLEAMAAYSETAFRAWASRSKLVVRGCS